jgi:ATP/maltotriose-dependent transcriptional regulator MalT
MAAGELTRLQLLRRDAAGAAIGKVVFFERSGDRDFDEHDRLLLNLLQPHLSALDAAARERRLAAALLVGQQGTGLVVLQSSDHVDFATPAARLLARCGDRRLAIRKAGRTMLLDEEIVTLTRRECDIVDVLAEGCSNTEIAERLTIAPTTVRKHLENIYAKLGVRTRTAAVAATRLHG